MKGLLKRAIISFLLFTLIAALMTGCNTDTPNSESQEVEVTEEDNSYPLTVTDQMGREVLIAKRPERIISLSPSNTEIIFALELDEELVGVTTFCEYPEAALAKEKVGGFSDPSLEKIISMEPDVVFVTSLHQELVEQLEGLQIPSVVLDPGNMEEMLESIILVGKASGVEERAIALTDDLRARIKAVTDKIEGFPEDQKPRVYYEIFNSPMITAGPNTFVDDIIRLAGGINIAADAQQSYPEYSQEMIVSKDPQIMFYSHHGTSQESIEDILARPGWESIEAIREKRVFYIDEDIVQLATPRLVEGLEAVAKLLQENFGK